MPSALKFPDCRGCRHKRTWRCAPCTVGEYFEGADGELDVVDALSPPDLPEDRDPAETAEVDNDRDFDEEAAD